MIPAELRATGGRSSSTGEALTRAWILLIKVFTHSATRDGAGWRITGALNLLHQDRVAVQGEEEKKEGSTVLHDKWNQINKQTKKWEFSY